MFKCLRISFGMFFTMIHLTSKHPCHLLLLSFRLILSVVVLTGFTIFATPQKRLLWLTLKKRYTCPLLSGSLCASFKRILPSFVLLHTSSRVDKTPFSSLQLLTIKYLGFFSSNSRFLIIRSLVNFRDFPFI